MAKKSPVPAAKVTRTITASEQRVLKMKKQKGDPTKDDVYPPKPPSRAIQKRIDEAVKAKQEVKAAAAEGKKEPPKPPVPLDAVPDIADCLPELVIEYQALLKDEDRIEARKRELSEELQALLAAVEQRSVLTETWQVSRAKGAHVQISKTKLVELGVSAAIIEQATVRKPTAYIVVTDPREAAKNKDKRGGGEEE